MKKGLLLVLAVLLVAGLFVSCNSDVSANAGASSKDHAYVTFDKASASKSVSPTVNPADAPSIEDLYWYYQAIKASGTVHEGEKTAWTRVNATTGLSGVIGPFSVGEWYFALVGMKTATDPAVTYSIDDYNNVTWNNYSGTNARYIGISGTSGYETKENVNIVRNQEQPTYIPMSLQQVNMTSDVTVKLDGLVLVGSSGISSGNSVWLDVLKGTGKLEDTIVVTAGTNGAVVPANTSREFTIDSAVEQVTLNFKLYDKTGENAPVVKEASVSFLATKGATVTLAGSLDAIEVYGSFDPDSYEAYVVSSTGKVTFKNTLTSAITDAQSGDTVVLLQNIEVTDSYEIAEGKTLLIDFNGHTVTSTNVTLTADAAGFLLNNGTVILTDNSNSTVGGVVSANNNVIINNGTMTINKGVFKGNRELTAEDKATVTRGVVHNSADGVMVINDIDLYVKQDYGVLNYGAITINGGTYASDAYYQTGLAFGYCVSTLGGNMVINGGTVTGKHGPVSNSGGSMVINNVSATVDGGSGYTSYYALYLAGENDECVTIINGGTFTGYSTVAALIGNKSDGGLGLHASVTINGGTYIGANNQQAIKLSNMGAGYGAGDVSISGGTYKNTTPNEKANIVYGNETLENFLASGYTVSVTADYVYTVNAQ